MKKTFLVFLVALILPCSVFAVSSLPWSTTFDCNDWQQPNTLSCDTIAKYGDWQCDASHPDQVTAAANMAVGGGGKGFRHWKGPGVNQNGGGIRFTTPSMPEFWVRYYMRYPAGFVVTAGDGSWYDKQIYLNYGGAGMSAFEQDVNQHKLLYSGHSYPMGAGSGFFPINDAMYGDNLWHSYEWHYKISTNLIELWIDGVFTGSITVGSLSGLGNPWPGFGSVTGSVVTREPMVVPGVNPSTMMTSPSVRPGTSAPLVDHRQTPPPPRFLLPQ